MGRHKGINTSSPAKRNKKTSHKSKKKNKVVLAIQAHWRGEDMQIFNKRNNKKTIPGTRGKK